VVGPSGSGKSSVVRAGLVPAIRRGGLPGSQNWFVIEMFPSAHPIEELALALMRVAVEPPNNLVGPLSLDRHGLLRVVDQVVPGADETEVVLVIDQFEELFTLVEDEAVRAHFLNSLITAVTDPFSRVRVIVTLRADFYDRPLLYPGFSELMRQRTEVVVPLAPDELKQAIISPAERNGLRVDPELVEAIVSDVAEQPGALPLLQYALTEVFERRSGRTLTLTPYNASGGVLGALARRAEEIYTGLRAEQQEAARQLFLRLVTLGEGVEDTRRRVRRTELATMTTDTSNPTLSSFSASPTLNLDQVIALYSQYRLLTLDNDPATRVPTIEVAHEALIRTWTRLRQWLDASRDDLRLQRRMTAAAAEWVASGHDRSFLASGARLEQLAGWAAETHLALNAEEREYLSASLAEREVQQAQEASRKAHEIRLERRSRSFLQALVGVALVAAIIGIGLSVYAFGQRREAQRNFTSAATAEAQAKQNAAQSDQNASRAELNANTAATAQAQAVVNAGVAQNRALLAGADAEYFQDNLDTARTLARLAVEQPNPLPDAETTFAQIAYSPGTRRVFQAPGAVTAAAISPDGTMAVSASDDKDFSIILWNLASGAELGRFEGGHTKALKQVLFLPDGKRMLTASEDHTVVLWDVAGRTPIRTFKAHTNEVRGMALRPNYNQFLSSDGDVNLLLWDIDCVTPSPTECTQPIKRFDQSKGGQAQELNHVAFTSDGARALTTSAEGSLVLWDVDAGTVLQHMEPTENRAELRSVAVLPGDKLALVGGASNDLTLWNLDSGTVARTFKGHKGTVYDVTVSPNGQFALSGSNDNTMMLWDLQDKTPIQRPLRTFYGHGDYIRKIVFSRDGLHALTGSKDKSMRYWDLSSGAEQARWTSPQGIKSGALSPDGRYVLTGVELDALLWDRETGKIARQFQGHSQAVKATAFSHDGKYIVTGGDKRDGAILLTDLASGQIVRTFAFETFGINALAFSPDDKYVVSGQIIATPPDYKARPSLNPELATIGMILWDAETGTVVSKFPELKGSVNALAFTADGTQVVAAVGGDITVWAIPSGDPVTTFKGDKSKINSMSVSADGKLALTGGQAKQVSLWDLTTGKQTFTSDVLASEITAVAISPDGRYGAAVTESRFFIYDLQSKQLIRTFEGHSKAVRFLCFSAVGRTLVSGAEDATVRTWRLDTRPELIAWAEANRHFADLTCDQAQLYNLPVTDCK
jgi:WD40 repeat protein